MLILKKDLSIVLKFRSISVCNRKRLLNRKSSTAQDLPVLQMYIQILNLEMYHIFKITSLFLSLCEYIYESVCQTLSTIILCDIVEKSLKSVAIGIEKS